MYTQRARSRPNRQAVQHRRRRAHFCSLCDLIGIFNYARSREIHQCGHGQPSAVSKIRPVRELGSWSWISLVKLSIPGAVCIYACTHIHHRYAGCAALPVGSSVLTFITSKQAVHHCRWNQQLGYLEPVTGKKNISHVTYQAVQPRLYHAQAASSDYPPAACAHAALVSSARIPAFLHFRQDAS